MIILIMVFVLTVNAAEKNPVTDPVSNKILWSNREKPKEIISYLNKLIDDKEETEESIGDKLFDLRYVLELNYLDAVLKGIGKGR